MSVLDRVELYLVKTPLAAPHAPSWIPGFIRTHVSMCVVRFVTDDGIEGWSGFPASGRERAGLGDQLSALFLGVDVADQATLTERIGIMAAGGSFNWWLEPAFWDIRGKAAGLPLYKLLGGTDDRIPLYASGGEIKDTGARREEAEKRHAEGFRTMKIRVHDFDEAVDIEHISDIATYMQGRMRISVDVNQAFRLTKDGDAPIWSLDRAKRFVDAAADVGLAWVEEPLFGEWHDQMAELTSYSRVPVAGSELHLMGYSELERMVTMRCYNIYQPDVMWAGGVGQVMQVAKLCRERGVRFTPHCWSNGFGFIANAHVFAASGFAGEELFEYPIAEPGWTPEGRDQIFTQPFLHDEGWFKMPQAPGLGFEIDRDVLKRCGRCYYAADRTSAKWMPEVLADWV
ncbi:mandelate racemase/muconate lactonizing enzyme family protein [Pseudooceanicola onchidii]|uniref:mandelate racemase/muconate lactonizing enzyme family protein n=1 Tax=Pseudooceanicola onchidii TaxID=2562279 RepID=UPI0010A9B609|nr:mandelate racemase/muconate lactonizing enzyme family protein [Pseudooceanicola onchidii]